MPEILAVDDVLAVGAILTRRDTHGCGDRRDAGHVLQLLDGVLKKPAGPQEVVERVCRIVRVHHVDALRAKAEVDVGQREKTAEEQPGANCERERQRHLDDDERMPHTIGRSSLPTSRLLQRIVQIHLRRLPRGTETEEEAGDQGHADREREHGPVDLNVGQTRQSDLLRGRGRQHTRADGSQQQPESTSCQRNHAALDAQLARDGRTTGAQRGTHRHLALSRRRARQQKVRDVGARDQQDQRDRAHQEEQRRTHRADQLLLQRDADKCLVLVGVRERRFETPADRPQLGVRRLERDPGFQKRHGAVVVGSPRPALGLRRDRDPHVRVAWKRERRGHDTHDLVDDAFQAQRPANRPRAGSEVALRERHADDRAACRIVQLEPAPERRR